ncbi:MAG: elongation factor P [Caldilineaceae bacterium]
MRNVRTGSTVEKTYNNGSRVQDVRLDSDDVQYLYNDGELYHFMNTETYEQIALAPDAVADVVPFMVDNQIVTLETYEGEPISVSLPTTVDLEVVWAEAAVAGDTANTPSKQVELETGFRMQVPMFVKEGDIIRVDTRDGSYVTRAQK